MARKLSIEQIGIVHGMAQQGFSDIEIARAIRGTPAEVRSALKESNFQRPKDAKSTAKPNQQQARPGDYKVRNTTQRLFEDLARTELEKNFGTIGRYLGRKFFPEARKDPMYVMLNRQQQVTNDAAEQLAHVVEQQMRDISGGVERLTNTISRGTTGLTREVERVGDRMVSSLGNVMASLSRFEHSMGTRQVPKAAQTAPFAGPRTTATKAESPSVVRDLLIAGIAGVVGGIVGGVLKEFMGGQQQNQQVQAPVSTKGLTANVEVQNLRFKAETLTFKAPIIRFKGSNIGGGGGGRGGGGSRSGGRTNLSQALGTYGSAMPGMPGGDYSGTSGSQASGPMGETSYAPGGMPGASSNPLSRRSSGGRAAHSLKGQVDGRTEVMELIKNGASDASVNDALKTLGMNEHKDRQALIEYMKKGKVSIDPEMTPWCAAWVASTLRQHNIKTPSELKGGANDLVANSFQIWGKQVAADQAKTGDIAINTRGKGYNEGGGHIGFVIKDPKTGQLKLFSGNQSDAVTVTPLNPKSGNWMFRHMPTESEGMPQDATPAKPGDGGGGSAQPAPGVNRGATKDYDPEQIAEFIRQKEGYNPHAYEDKGHYSIGYGSRANSPNEVIDKKEAARRLQSEMNLARKQVDSLNPNLGPGTRDALTSYFYNTGGVAVFDKRNKHYDQELRDAIIRGDDETIKRLMPKHDTAVTGEHMRGLHDRRAEETGFIGKGGKSLPADAHPEDKKPDATPEAKPSDTAPKAAPKGDAPKADGQVYGPAGKGSPSMDEIDRRLTELRKLPESAKKDYNKNWEPDESMRAKKDDEFQTKRAEAMKRYEDEERTRMQQDNKRMDVNDPNRVYKEGEVIPDPNAQRFQRQRQGLENEFPKGAERDSQNFGPRKDWSDIGQGRQNLDPNKYDQMRKAFGPIEPGQEDKEGGGKLVDPTLKFDDLKMPEHGNLDEWEGKVKKWIEQGLEQRDKKDKATPNDDHDKPKDKQSLKTNNEEDAYHHKVDGVQEAGRQSDKHALA